MAIRWYLVPVEGTGVVNDSRRPQFISGAIAGAWAAIDYGNEPWMIVRADVTAGEHTSISGQATVVTVPSNLDATIGANLATVQAALESRGFPADWITAGMSYRTVLRWLIRLCFLTQRGVQRLGAALDRLYASGRTLDSTVGDIPAQMRSNLSAGAQSWGLDVSGITLAMTIRQALKLLGNQMTTAVPLVEA